MIKVVRHGNDVQLKVDAFLPTWNTRVFPFTFHCSNTEYAALLTDRIDDMLREAVRTAREEAYNEGYADGRGKKKRRTFFSSVLD